MKRLMVLAVMALVVGIGVQAQGDGVEYRLKVPTAEEYVENADEIISEAETTYEGDEFNALDYLAEISILADEIEWRLLDKGEMTYEQLNSIYQLTRARLHEQPYRPISDYQWIPALLRIWLAENPIDLFTTDDFQMDAYHIRVHRLDIGFDRSNGYLLQVLENRVTRGYYVVLQDREGQLTFPELPYPIESDLFAVGRLNGDEDPDIAYFHTTHAGNSYRSGALVIASFRDGRFEVISEVGYREGPEGGAHSWRFLQIDNDSELELFQNQRLSDNWGCDFIKVRFFDWLENSELQVITTEDVLPDSFNCLLVQAEQAMWEHDYPTAIALYEKALNAQSTDLEWLPFAQLRLGLAYLLTGQNEQAEEIFTTLSVGDYAYARAIQEAYQHDPRLLAVCQEMYNYVAEYPGNALKTTGRRQIYDGGYYGYDPSAFAFDFENTSCDLPSVLIESLEQTTFTTDQSPLEQLEALGLTVKDFISEDFDSDGEPEWLVWLGSIGVDPIFFHAEGSAYRLSRLRSYYDISMPGPDVRLPDVYNQYSFMTLPDGLGKALVIVDFGEDEYSNLECAGCGGGPSMICPEYDATLPRRVGDLTIWRLEAGQLVMAVFTPLCEMVTVDQLFPDGDGATTLHAANFFLVDPLDLSSGNTVVLPATYYWDSATKTYALPPQPTPIPTVTPITSPVPTATASPAPVRYYGALGFERIREAFLDRDYELVEEIADIALSDPSEAQQQWLPAFRYYRALALEALNRPDEALAEYVTIYETAPESAWGMLAGLHLEIVSG